MLKKASSFHRKRDIMGIVICVLAMVLGSILGILFKEIIPSNLKDVLMKTFGFGAITIGIVNIVKVSNITAVILALIVGVIIGEFLRLEKNIEGMVSFIVSSNNSNNTETMNDLIMAILIFCASSSGIFGAITLGLTGSSEILVAKSVLDFFTAIILAASIGKVMLLVAIPEAMILALMFLVGRLVGGYITMIAINDFMAIGGIITLLIGLKISKIIEFPILNTLPSFLIVFLTSMAF